MINIGLIGKMGSGKDTAAEALICTHGYVPIAFAKPLKEMVIEADPLVTCGPTVTSEHMRFHLSDLLDCGWTFEEAKREFPEVRRSLQRIGQGVRKLDPDYWVNLALDHIHGVKACGVPIVVTDVRYPNEADVLRKSGFRLVRIKRIGLTTNGYTTDESRAMLHPSETALDKYDTDVTINNDGDVLGLYDKILSLVEV